MDVREVFRKGAVSGRELSRLIREYPWIAAEELDNKFLLPHHIEIIIKKEPHHAYLYLGKVLSEEQKQELVSKYPHFLENKIKVFE